jgi:hypothetical protein
MTIPVSSIFLKKFNIKNKSKTVLILLLLMQINSGNTTELPIPDAEHVTRKIPTDHLEGEKTFVLRLGSSPETESYIPGIYQKQDNTYQSLMDGSYARRLATLNVRLQNVVHVHIVEQQPYAYKWKSMPYYWYTSDKNRVTNLVADFNSNRFPPLFGEALLSLEAPSPQVDLIITDDRVAKFIVARDTVFTLMRMLKPRGVLVVTDLDEDYEGERYDPDCMFYKLSPAVYVKKFGIFDDPTIPVNQTRIRHGLLDLMFNPILDTESPLVGPFEYTLGEQVFISNFYINPITYLISAKGTDGKSILRSHKLALSILPFTVDRLKPIPYHGSQRMLVIERKD